MIFNSARLDIGHKLCTHLTRETLNHSLSFCPGIIRPATATKQAPKVLPVAVPFIHVLRCFVQSACMRQRSGRTIASEITLREQLELFMVRVTCNRAGWVQYRGLASMRDS
jgi:hypothetical protein